jgi:hypothetical protein
LSGFQRPLSIPHVWLKYLASSIPKRPKAPCKVLLDTMHCPKLNLGMAAVDWIVHDCHNFSRIGVRFAWLGAGNNRRDAHDMLSPRACRQLILCRVLNQISYASWQGLYAYACSFYPYTIAEPSYLWDLARMFLRTLVLQDEWIQCCFF